MPNSRYREIAEHFINTSIDSIKLAINLKWKKQRDTNSGADTASI